MMRKMYMQAVLKQNNAESKLVQLKGLGQKTDEGTAALTVN